MKRILLIEHNKDHSDLITRSLRQGFKGIQIKNAVRVKDALGYLDKGKFDLILTDFYLPDSRGEAHIKRLAEKAPETPIIIITGRGDEKTAARSIKAGADDYIIKTREALMALPRILNRAFAKHQSHLKKKNAEIRKKLLVQEKAMKRILTEVESLERQIENLHQPKSSPKKPPSPSLTSLEGLIRQVGQLRDFIQNKFSSHK